MKPTADYNLDDNVNSTDTTHITAQSGVTLGWGPFMSNESASVGFWISTETIEMAAVL